MLVAVHRHDIHVQPNLQRGNLDAKPCIGQLNGSLMDEYRTKENNDLPQNPLPRNLRHIYATSFFITRVVILVTFTITLVAPPSAKAKTVAESGSACGGLALGPRSGPLLSLISRGQFVPRLGRWRIIILRHGGFEVELRLSFFMRRDSLIGNTCSRSR
ncbi:hypothetical protein CC79DRAFT_153706 [Sarocladium strictum]